jgi:hypothetical protein
MRLVAEEMNVNLAALESARDWPAWSPLDAITLERWERHESKLPELLTTALWDAIVHANSSLRIDSNYWPAMRSTEGSEAHLPNALPRLIDSMSLALRASTAALAAFEAGLELDTEVPETMIETMWEERAGASSDPPESIGSR